MAADKELVKKPKKDKGERKGLGRKLKEIWSELKKVSWPTFPTVLKNTGTVLAVVGIFLVMLLGFDLLLRFLVYNPLQTGTIKGPSSDALSSLVGGLGATFNQVKYNLISMLK